MSEVTNKSIRSAVSEILKGGDLDSLTSRKVRRQLEEKFKENLADRKDEIDKILMELIESEKAKNGHDEDDDGDEVENVKKNSDKESNSEVDEDVDDEALARKLQAEEKNTRTRSAKKVSSKKKESPVKKRKTIPKKCLLSPELAEIVGESEMARAQVVKRMWEVVKERDLFYPQNKQFCVCDNQLKKVFGVKKVRMFGMMKYLKKHITDVS